jgi:hypothetical protein
MEENERNRLDERLEDGNAKENMIMKDEKQKEIMVKAEELDKNVTWCEGIEETRWRPKR